MGRNEYKGELKIEKRGGKLAIVEALRLRGNHKVFINRKFMWFPNRSFNLIVDTINV
jgi:hypothetical protein